MNTNEIIEKIKKALDLANTDDYGPFSYEERKEMIDWLDAQKMPEIGYGVWKRGEKPRWNVGDILAYYIIESDYEGEQFLGEIVDINFDEDADDWAYVFNDGYFDFEESLTENRTYTVSKEYYEKHY